MKNRWCVCVCVCSRMRPCLLFSNAEALVVREGSQECGLSILSLKPTRLTWSDVAQPCAYSVCGYRISIAPLPSLSLLSVSSTCSARMLPLAPGDAISHEVFLFQVLYTVPSAKSRLPEVLSIRIDSIYDQPRKGQSSPAPEQFKSTRVQGSQKLATRVARFCDSAPASCLLARTSSFSNDQIAIGKPARAQPIL